MAGDPRSWRIEEFAFAMDKLAAPQRSRLESLLQRSATLRVSPGESILEIAKTMPAENEYIVVAEPDAAESCVLGVADVKRIIERRLGSGANRSPTLLEALHAMAERDERPDEPEEPDLKEDEDSGAPGPETFHDRAPFGWCSVHKHYTVLPCRGR